jgi:hypothetical protein
MVRNQNDLAVYRIGRIIRYHITVADSGNTICNCKRIENTGKLMTLTEVSEAFQKTNKGCLICGKVLQKFMANAKAYKDNKVSLRECHGIPNSP